MSLFLHQFLFFSFSVFLLITVFPKIFFNYYSYETVGTLMMFFQFSNLILIFLLSKFTFKGKFIPIIYFLYFLNSVILYLFIDNLVITIFSFLFFAILYNLMFAYNDSMILEKYKEKYGKYRAIGSLFFVIMSIFSFFYIKDYNDIFFIFIISTGLIFLNSFNLSKKTVKLQQNISIKKEHVFREKSLFIFAILFNISLGIYFSFYSIFLLELGYSINQVFIIFGISVAAETIMLFLQHKIINKNDFFNVYNLLIISVFITSIRFILIQLFPYNFEIQIIANLLHLFTFSLFFGAMLLYFKNKYPEEHFIYTKLYRGIGFGIGGTFGAFISGYLYNSFSDIYFYFPAFFAFISIYYLLKMKKENQLNLLKKEI